MRVDARLDENASLRRQSILIALLCVIVDLTVFSLVDVAGHAWTAAVFAVAATILVIDLTLALPPATAGWIALAHGVVRCGIGVAMVSIVPGGYSLGNAAGLVLAGYRAGAWLRGRRSVGALAVLMIGMTVNQWVQGFDEVAGSDLGLAAVGGAVFTTVSNTFFPWLVGRYTTTRSGYIDQVERRAEAERQAARQALTEGIAQERGAIARDLHDTISHHVSAIGVHAAAARLGLAAGAGLDQPRSALAQVEICSLAAMSDLRRMLDLLHDQHRDGVQQPGLRNIDELLEGARRTGLDVHLQPQGLDPSRLRSSVDIAAYHVTQEILTNALRHGDGPRLDLRIEQDEQHLVITGRNRVPVATRPSPGTGRGLDGLRQRADLFSGTLESGPSPDGHTWSTRICFPLETVR